MPKGINSCILQAQEAETKKTKSKHNEKHLLLGLY